MKVAFGVSLSPGTPLLQEKDTRKFIDLAKMADDYGAEAVGTHDTAFIGGDAYVRATLIALGASRARVGLRPTNPLTRAAPTSAAADPGRTRDGKRSSPLLRGRGPFP